MVGRHRGTSLSSHLETRVCTHMCTLTHMNGPIHIYKHTHRASKQNDKTVTHETLDEDKKAMYPFMSNGSN